MPEQQTVKRAAWLETALSRDARYGEHAYEIMCRSFRAAQEDLFGGVIEDGKEYNIPIESIMRAVGSVARTLHGPLAAVVLADSGLRTAADIRELFGNMIQVGEVRLGPGEKLEDFDRVPYDLQADLKEYSFVDSLRPDKFSNG